MKKPELKALLITARDRNAAIAIGLSQSSNPQVARACTDANAKAETLQADRRTCAPNYRRDQLIALLCCIRGRAPQAIHARITN